MSWKHLDLVLQSPLIIMITGSTGGKITLAWSIPLRFLDQCFPCLGHFRALYLLHYFCRWFRCCIKYLYLPFPRPLWRPWAGGGRVPAEDCIRPGHGRAASLLTTFRHQAPGPGSKWFHASTYRGLAAFTFYAQSWNETRKSIKAINCYSSSLLCCEIPK